MSSGEKVYNVSGLPASPEVATAALLAYQASLPLQGDALSALKDVYSSLMQHYEWLVTNRRDASGVFFLRVRPGGPGRLHGGGCGGGTR